MIGVLRSEWIKFRSVRSNVLLVVAAGLLVVLVAFFAARSAQNDNTNGSRRYDCPSGASVTTSDGGTSNGTTADPVEQGGVPPSGCTEVVRSTHLGDITVGVPFALFLFGALGVQILGQEYRFNTIRPTFTAVPRRLRVLVAKLAVVSVACAVISAVMVGVCALIGSAMVDGFNIDGVDHRVIGGIVLFGVGWTALGMGVGAILRQPIAAMLVLLIEGFVIENVVLGIFPRSASWLPFLNGIQMTTRDTVDDRLRSVTAGGIYFFVIAAVVWAVGAVLANRRDA